MTEIRDIYCDFDGTITKKDCVNTFFELYADKSWIDWENLWIEGKITSQENAIKQVALIQQMPLKTLEDYLDSIEIDEYFLDFVQYVKKNNYNLTIVSDGFDLFIEKTLQKYGISDIKFYANHLIYKDGRFSIEFPHFTKSCEIGAGMCKCSKVKNKNFCYIGDGTSDLCIAKKATRLFATKNLHEYCEKNLIQHYYFNSFRNIIELLESVDGE